MQTQSAASLQYATFTVTALLGDPTGYDVFAAFTTSATIPPQSWTAASWVAGISPMAANTYMVEILVGPGSSLDLAAGSYNAWIRIASNPEIPVIPAGILEIY